MIHHGKTTLGVSQMTIKSLLIIGLNLALVTSNAQAHGNNSHNSASPVPQNVAAGTIGSASLKLLETPIELHNEYGKAYFIENPTNDEQRYINQGFASLNVFHYADAYRSFRMAAIKNNDSIFASVGMVFSILQQDTGAAALKIVQNILNNIEKIKDLHPINKKEAVWSDYVRSLYVSTTGSSAGLTNPQNILGANQAFNAIMVTDGNNVEAQSFLTWTILSGQTLQYVVNSQKEVLKKYPTHAGALHYLLHIAEMQNEMKKAVDYGVQLAAASLGSAHAQHMYGHALPQFGRWQEALDQFLIADRIHHNWAKKYNVALHEDWHYAHNLDLMAGAYLGLGNTDKAFDNWSASMPYDYRAIHKAIGVLLFTNQLEKANQLLGQIESQGEAWKNFVKPLKDEWNLLYLTIEPTGSFRFGSYEYMVQELLKAQKGIVSQSSVTKVANQYFINKLKSGGFDGWSHGFVELLRLQNIAKTLKLGEVESQLEAIVVAARAGTL